MNITSKNIIIPDSAVKTDNNITITTINIANTVPHKNVSDNVEPKWITKHITRQLRLNKRYETAHNKLALRWNKFLSTIDDINYEYGTDFTAKQALIEFNGNYVYAEDDGEEDED